MPARELSRFIALGLLKEATRQEGDEEDGEGEPIYIPVDSTAIRSIAWSPGNVITVEFNRGGTYYYDGDRDLFDAFAAAPSKGGFFNAHFK
jgi:hypothetical protein